MSEDFEIPTPEELDAQKTKRRGLRGLFAKRMKVRPGVGQERSTPRPPAPPSQGAQSPPLQAEPSKITQPARTPLGEATDAHVPRRIVYRETALPASKSSDQVVTPDTPGLGREAVAVRIAATLAQAGREVAPDFVKRLSDSGLSASELRAIEKQLSNQAGQDQQR